MIPDEQTWTVWGTDPAASGLVPVLAPGLAAKVVAPAAVPGPLRASVEQLVAELPHHVVWDTRSTPLLGAEQEAHAAHHGHEGHDEEPHRHDGAAGHGDHHGHAGHEGHHGHAGHGHAGHGHAGHEDMMAITGDPSSDGLVMESIDVRLGPIGTPLPGGLVIEAQLDGDVVGTCEVRATLQAPRAGASPPLLPDALAPAAWTAAIDAADDLASGAAPPASALWLRIATVELERAISHLAWLRAFARLLGWPRLVRPCTDALGDLLAARRLLAVELDAPDPPAIDGGDFHAIIAEAQRHVARLRAWCGRSRLLAARTAGRGAVDPAWAHRVGGPIARASGHPVDARSGDGLYRALDFVPLTREEGDARARTLLRIDEASASLRLAAAAIERCAAGEAAPLHPAPGGEATVEGPRGPVSAQRLAGNWRLSAPGARRALDLAGRAAVGAEWAAALVVLASFDLSPWMVGP